MSFVAKPMSTRDVVRALSRENRALSIVETRSLVFRLGVQTSVLDDIEKEFSGDTCKQKFVEKWLDIDPSASWGKLVSGLREINVLSLASEVESEYYVPGTEAPPPASNVTTSHLQRPISTLAQQEEAPLSVVVSTPPPLTPASNPAVSMARVIEVRVRIEYFEEEFSEINEELSLELLKRESHDDDFFKRFQCYLLALPATKKRVHIKFFQQSEDDIVKAKEVLRLFAILNRYCNFNNYEITLIVVKKFCGERLQQRMLAYKELHVKFEKNTTVDVYLHAIPAPPESPIFAGFTKMVMKIKKPVNMCTLYEIRQRIEFIAFNAFLQPYSVYIEPPQKGSVRVVMLFPEECSWLVGRVLLVKFLEAHQLTEVTVDGEDLKSYLVRLVEAKSRNAYYLHIYIQW